MAEVIDQNPEEVQDQDVANQVEDDIQQDEPLTPENAPEYAIHSCSTSAEVDGQTVEGEVTLISHPGDTIQEALDKFGEEVVYDLYTSQYSTKIQNAARARLRQYLQEGKDPFDAADRVEAELADWRPDVTRRRSKDPKKSVTDQFESMSADEQKALLAQLMNMAESKNAGGE